MRNANPYAVLRDAFAPRTAEPFLVSPAHTTTYGAIDQQSAAIARALSTLGVRRGDRVAVQVPKSAEAVALYLACLRIGAVYLPLNEGYTAHEVAYFVGDATPVLFVGDDGISPSSGPPSFTLDALIQRASSAAPLDAIAALEGSDVVAMLYTSGTTGRAKGAMLTCDNLVTNAVALHRLWGFTSADVLVHALPIFHVHGLFVALHCAMLSGCEVRFLPRFDPAVLRAELLSSTVMMGVPTFYARLLSDPDFGRDDCRSMRLFISGSAPLTEGVHREFTARTGHEILERYGMTETGMITSNPLVGERIAGTVGYALPGVEVRVADDKGLPLPIDAAGVVEVRGPNVCAGYWGMPEKTATSRRDGGWFITGDVGTLAADGRLTLVGRESDLIIVGGYNVYPKEIELLVDDMDGVAESAVVGLPHPDLGEGVAVFIVARPGASIDADEVRAELAPRLARFKQPRAVFVVDDLPRNAMGKVQKAKLRADHASTFG